MHEPLNKKRRWGKDIAQTTKGEEKLILGTKGNKGVGHEN